MEPCRHPVNRAASSRVPLRSAGLSVSMNERKDGASQKDVDAAWETYKGLMKT